MKDTTIQREYGFRARAHFSYNPDNDVSPSSKRRRRKIAKSKTSSNKYFRAAFHHD